MRKSQKFRGRYGQARVRNGIACKFCGADRGEACWGRHGQQKVQCHMTRHLDYERAQGDRPKLRGKVTIRFECPVCGADHHRRDCPSDA